MDGLKTKSIQQNHIPHPAPTLPIMQLLNSWNMLSDRLPGVSLVFMCFTCFL